MTVSPQLGAERTTLIGRDRDVLAVEGLLGEAERLVTLVGPAGVGKTRLALHLAARRAGVADARVDRVDLRGARGVDEIAALVGSAVQVTLRAGDGLGPVEQIGMALAGRGASLLVLDDFDHLVPLAEETVGRWLELAPALRCLVTSRQALGIAGELRHEVSPLAPDDALELFAARVRATAPGFELNAATRDVAREIVQRLDHLPLAIELAAARSALLAPQEILGRLDRRLDLLRVGAGHRIASRHTTLRDALDWSWSLLSEAERAALAALAVFEGGFSLAAGTAVLGGDEPAALDLMTALREKSLLVISASPEAVGETRLNLLQSVRELAGEKLDERRERDAVERLHAAYYLEVGEAWAAGIRGPRGEDALRRLRLDAGNLIAAGRTSLRHQPASSVRIALALAEALVLSGPLAQVLELLDQAAAVAAGLAGDRDLHPRALLLRGAIRAVCGRQDEGTADLEEAVRLARESGERSVEGQALRLQGVSERDAGDFAAAHDHLERAAALFEERGELANLGRTVGNLGSLYRQEGRLEAARLQYHRAIEIHRQVGDRGAEAVVLCGLGHLEGSSGRPDQAMSHYQEALPILQAVRDRRTEAGAVDRLAALTLAAGDPAGALSLLDGVKDHLVAVGDPRLQAVAAAHRAIALAALGEEASGSMELATRIVQRIDDVRLSAALRVLAACVDHLGGADRESGSRVARDAADDERRLAVAPGLGLQVEYISDARRLLDSVLAGALDRVAGGAERPAGAGEPVGAVEVGPASAWIRLSSGVELRLPPLLARLFDALLEERLARPGQPIATEALAARMWPDQPLEPRAAAERLHSAIAKLRRRGLDELVVRQAGGYLLHPAVPCARVNEPRE